MHFVIRYPGLWHLFVRLYLIFFEESCSRLTCRHVDLFKFGLNVLFKFDMFKERVVMSIFPRLVICEPLERVYSFDVPLDLNDSVHVRYPGFRHLYRSSL